MKRSCAGLMALALVGWMAPWASAELVDGVAATVGTEVILHSELVKEIVPFLNNLRKSAASDAEFDRQADAQLRVALEEAIDNKILLREALLAGLEIKDKAVEERIAEIRKRFNSDEEFQKELERVGETMSDFRERVRKQILAISMGSRKHHLFEKEADVSEAQIAQYYTDNKDKFAHPARVELRRIFVAAGADPQERAKAKARLEDLKKQIDGGADFAELAKANSAGPEAAEGGLAGWVTHDDLVKALADAAFALPVGGVSDALETEFGVVLLKVEKKQAEGTLSLDDARKEIEPELRKKFAEEKYKKWMSELRKRSRVRIFLAATTP